MSNPHQTSATTIPSLDGWRALAILLVFLSHAGLGNVVPGGLGVTIFFFLSGYLITTLTCREFDRNKTISIRKFYARRALRLLPPLVVTLLVTYTLAAVGILGGGYSFQGFFAQLLYFANYYSLFFDPGSTTPTGTGVFWSLAVEEHFYFIFPVIFLMLSSLSGRSKLIVCLAVVAVLVLMWRIYLVVIMQVPENRTYYATDTRIDSIVYGCLLALVCNPWEYKQSQSSLTVIDCMFIAFGVLGLLFSILYRNPIFRETFRYTLQGFALMPLFFYSIKCSKNHLFRPLQWGFVRRVGVLSYSIYLVHYILLSNMKDLTLRPVFDVVLALVCAFIFAIVIDRFIDSPARKLKKRFY